MNCPDNCPQLVKGKDSEENRYFLCSAKTIVVGFKTHHGFRHPVYGAKKLEEKNGKPVKSCKF